MINAIIFSKDRAPQLRLLIYSILKNSPNTFKLSVIYKSSNESFNKGYEKVKGEFSSVCNFVSQTDNFKEDVLKLLNDDSEYSCFFTDDDIIYKPFESNKIIQAIESDPDVFCFSLRLGINTSFCYAMNTPNVFRDYEEADGVLKWDWSVHYLDFGYPLSVDGHIFKTKDILKLTKKVGFVNPNTYEASLQIFDSFPKNKMTSFSESVLVNTPNNIVNTSFANRNGLTYGVEVKDLNDEYLSGNVIDLESMDFTDIKGCHQELEFKYKEEAKDLLTFSKK
jgi:hypothetical protein